MTTRPTDEKVVYPELSFAIVGLAIDIHNQLGPGFGEDIYEKAMAYELAAHHVPFEEQKVVQVVYKGQPMGTYRLDLVVDDKIIVELKALPDISPLCKQQLLSYLKATHLRLGLVLNFGAGSLQQARVPNL
jgi:GxxExxY protein